MKRWCVFLCGIAMAACVQSADKKTGSVQKQQQQSTSNPSKDSNYKPPDGGFGTLDDARDVRKESEDQQRESQDALDQTQ